MATFTQAQFDRLLANIQFVDLVANGAVDEGGTGIVESPGGELVRTAAKVINDIADTESTVLGYRNDALAAQSAAEDARDAALGAASAAEDARDAALAAISNGTSTSGFSVGANITSITDHTIMWARNGDIVTFSGHALVSNSGTSPKMLISPPVATTFVVNSDLNNTSTILFDRECSGVVNTAIANFGFVYGDATANKICVAIDGLTPGISSWFFSGSYRVK